MQGWRKSMEDAHVTQCDIIPGVSVFGVFDGHGGQEVAQYMEDHLVEQLKKNNNFKEGLYKQALIDVFLMIDQMVISEPGVKELLKTATKNNPSTASNINPNDLPFQAGCTACVALITPKEI